MIALLKLAPLAYWLFILLRSQLSFRHGLLGIGIALSIHPRFLKFHKIFISLVWFLIFFDSQKYYAHWLRGSVRVIEPYFFDKTFFGIHGALGSVTPSHWWQQHSSVLLDIFFSSSFLGVYFLFAFQCFSFLYRSSPSDSKSTPKRVFETAGDKMIAALFSVSVLSTATAFLYPAAPPWYLEKHGLGPALLDTSPSLGRLVRVDQIIGFPFFQSFFIWTDSPFEAIPALPASVAVITMHYSFKVGRYRPSNSVLFPLSLFALSYLNLHYVVDILWGVAYGLIACWCVDTLYKFRIDAHNNPR